eukprot:519021-Rhodomonas_salina.1
MRSVLHRARVKQAVPDGDARARAGRGGAVRRRKDLGGADGGPRHAVPDLNHAVGQPARQQVTSAWQSSGCRGAENEKDTPGKGWEQEQTRVVRGRLALVGPGGQVNAVNAPPLLHAPCRLLRLPHAPSTDQTRPTLAQAQSQPRASLK